MVQHIKSEIFCLLLIIVSILTYLFIHEMTSVQGQEGQLPSLFISASPESTSPPVSTSDPSPLLHNIPLKATHMGQDTTINPNFALDRTNFLN